MKSNCLYELYEWLKTHPQAKSSMNRPIIIAAVIIAVAIVLAAFISRPENSAKYSFHRPATIFDNKDGKIYEISGCDQYVVEYDVVNGKKNIMYFTQSQGKSSDGDFTKATNAIRRIAEDVANEIGKQKENHDSTEYDFYLRNNGFIKVPKGEPCP